MTYRKCPHGYHHPPGPHSCDGCWCEGERDRAMYGWDHDTAPTMDDLRRAGIEAHLHPIRRRIDEMVAALPWHGRLLYRATLPVARRYYAWKERRR